MDRLRHEAGQTVVLFAVLLPLFLGVGAIAVDVGYWYVVKKTAQDAADAAALAAARELPNDIDARARARDYVRANMPDALWEVEFPYTSGDAPYAGIGDGGAPDYTKIEVTVTHPAGTFFGRAFGILDLTVSRRAVAERLGGSGNLAIFAHSRDCDEDLALEFDARDVYINGLVHSNGRFRVSNGPFWAAEGTHNKPNCPSSIDSSAQSQFGESMPPPSGTACAGQPCREPNDDVDQNWPAWFIPAQFGWPTECTYSGAVIQITENVVKVDGQGQPFAGAIPAGTYCATTSFNLDGRGLTGTITALAPEITIDGSDLRLSPYASDVLFFAVPNTNPVGEFGSLETGGNAECSGDPAVTLNGDSHTWSGIVFNPCGLITVNLAGSSAGAPALSGAIIGERVEVNGSDFYMNGADNLTLQPHLALVE